MLSAEETCFLTMVYIVLTSDVCLLFLLDCFGVEMLTSQEKLAYKVASHELLLVLCYIHLKS